MSNARLASHEDMVATLSRAWVEEIAVQLEEEGRRLEGGWPGTLSDARRRLVLHMRGGSTRAISDQHFDQVVQQFYAAAKAGWLARAGR